MFEKVNLERALRTERNVQKESSGNQILSTFRSYFETDWENDQRVLGTIKKGAVSSELPSADNLEEDRIYDLNSIKNLCIKYRLRFLSTKQFKGELPTSVFSSVRKTEKQTGQNLDAFMIAAPAKLFNLEDSNKDPLLFTPLDDGRFYLIDKWGNDLAWYRRMVNWPLTSPLTLLTTIFALCAFLAAIIPSGMLSASNDYFTFMRLVAFGWNVIFLLGITSYFWFASHAKFSIHAWNSKSFN